MRDSKQREELDNYELEDNYDFWWNKFYKPKKVPTSMRLDNDILIFLKKKLVKKDSISNINK